MASGPLPFGELFRTSVTVSLRLWKPLFLGFLLYGVVAFAVAMAFGASLVSMLGSMSFSEGQPPSALGPGVVIGVMVLFLCLFLLGMAFQVGILDLAVERSPRLRDTVKRIPKLFGRYIAAAFWMFVRTYIWVPLLIILGLTFLSGGDPSSAAMLMPPLFLAIIVLGLVFGPRVMFGQVIFIRENVSGRQSVALSEQRTRGYWGKVVGNWLLMTLILGAIQMGLQLAFGGVLGGIGQSGASPEALAGVLATGGVGLLVMAVVVPFLALIPMVFLTELYDTIKANPQK